jgi:hypothetical protein
MIERPYMGIDWRRDHSFRIPRPDLDARIGAPDACTDCHTDRDAAWAAAALETWYPESTNRGPHFGTTIAAGRRDPVAAAADLAALATDTAMPGIARATALWLLEQSGDPERAAQVADLLSNPDPLIRQAAVGAQRTAPAQDRVLRLIERLADPVRSVRQAAARELLSAPIARLPDAIAADLQAATGEWQASLANRLDFPETHLQLAGTALATRNLPAAEAAFREAVSLDPQRTDAWAMIVRIAAATRGPGAAAAALEEAFAVNPNNEMLQDLAAALGLPSR